MNTNVSYGTFTPKLNLTDPPFLFPVTLPLYSTLLFGKNKWNPIKMYISERRCPVILYHEVLVLVPFLVLVSLSPALSPIFDPQHLVNNVHCLSVCFTRSSYGKVLTCVRSTLR